MHVFYTAVLHKQHSSIAEKYDGALVLANQKLTFDVHSLTIAVLTQTVNR